MILYHLSHQGSPNSKWNPINLTNLMAPLVSTVQRRPEWVFGAQLSSRNTVSAAGLQFKSLWKAYLLYTKRNEGMSALSVTQVSCVVNALSLLTKKENQHLCSMCQALVTGLVTFISTANPRGGVFTLRPNRRRGAGTDDSLRVPGLLATGCRFRASRLQGLGFLTTLPLEKVRCRSSCNYYVFVTESCPTLRAHGL